MTAIENHAERRTYRPPYWCADCDAGQSVDRCWLCCEPCETTPPCHFYQDGRPAGGEGSLPSRYMASAGPWWPEPEEVAA